MKVILQLSCSQLLLDISRAAVENPHQGLLVKALNLGLDRLYILDHVAFRYLELWHSRPGRDIVQYRVDLGGIQPGEGQLDTWARGKSGYTYSEEFNSNPKLEGSIPIMREL